MKLSPEALGKIRVAAKLGKDKDIQVAIDEALEEVNKKPMAQEAEEFVMSTDGYFSSTEVYKALHLSTEPAQHRRDVKNISIILRRLRERGVVEKYGSKQGVYRKIERDCDVIDWQNAPSDDMPVKFPLDIHDYVRIYPSNIIIVAGESNAGKTAFLLDFIRLNMDNYGIHYFNSEMGASELKIRLGLFRSVGEWKFTAWERSDNFIDVIRPDSINVIDFLDVTDEFWKVGGIIKGIHEKLAKGIALIGLQKNEGHWDSKAQKWVSRDLGRGGALSIEKPRLYLSMGRGTIKITKAKNWKGKNNPNGMTRDFKLYSGSEFAPTSFWSKSY